MASALQALSDRLSQRDVTLTLDTLKKAGRQLLPMRFNSDTKLQRLEEVLNYNILVKDFPINSLLTATDVEAIRVCRADAGGPIPGMATWPRAYAVRALITTACVGAGRGGGDFHPHEAGQAHQLPGGPVSAVGAYHQPGR
jgi:hypothetical protein